MQMKKENLRKKSNSSQDDYRKDKPIGEELNPLVKILGAASIVAGGVLAYKNGAFRGATSKILDVADYYKQDANNLYSSVKTFSSWANFSSNRTDSVIRQMPKLNTISTNDGRQRIINDTRNDFSDLFNKVNKSKEKLDNKVKYNIGTYYDTELVSNINEIDNIANQYKKYTTNRAMSNRAKKMMANDLHSYMKVSDDVAKSQKTKTGYRSLTLEDIIKVIDKKGVDGKMTKGIMSINPDFKLDKASTSTIEKFMQETSITYKSKDGIKKNNLLINTDSWKDFRLDNGIMINEKGKIIDVRHASKYPKEFIRSLANDYQIPLLNFNPLRFFGADRVGVKSNRYGVIHQSTVQNALTGKRGSHTLKSTGEFGKTPLLFVNGDVFQFNDDVAATVKNNKPIATNMKVDKVSKSTNSYGIRSDLNAYRKMAGLNTKSYTLYNKDEDGTIKSFFSSVMAKLDIGFQDRDRSVKQMKTIVTKDGKKKVVEVDQDDGALSVDRMIEKLRSGVGEFIPKPYKEVTEKTKITDVFGIVDESEDLFLLRHKDVSLREVVDSENQDIITEYFKDFFVSGKDPTKIGDKGIFIYTVSDRLNQTLANVGLGLSNENSKSAAGIITNLATRRFLPIYGAYQTMQYITYLSERDDENKGNIQKDISEVFKTVDLGLHKVKDLTGLTSVIDRLTDLMPGSDHITELPGIYNIGIDKTYEEQKEYYENGMDAVRKGRYWEIGNTPFTGSKISYYRPNLYRRIQGDVMFTDSKYGSREEYFDNFWATSPIKTFITDKYHYEKKHYYDRPYMLTSPAFENVPVVGSVLSGTIGKVIKPQRKMHTEYWGDQSQNENKEQYDGDIIVNSKIGDSLSKEGAVAVDNNATIDNATIDNGANQNILYTTTSGKRGFYSVDTNETNLRNVNYEINKGTISNVDGVELSSSIPKQENESIQTANMPNDLKTTLASQYTNLTNLTGMTGYITETFITGTPLEDQKVLDTMGYSMSFNKAFWDQEIGGLGGAMSEIFRRFFPDKNKDYEYVNPVKNTMPSWMPREEYFIDFTKGDPYNLVKWGEGRLPGEGYEQLWNLKDPLDMKIGSSSLGKSKEDLKKHLLHQDITTDQGLIDIMDKGTKMHETIEEELLSLGIAKSSEVEIYDKEHNVSGIYDIELNDGNELTGREGIMDVKTVSSKKFDEILESGEIRAENKSQVNFYLKNLDMEYGSIMYVDRDNPERTNVLEFKYDEDLYEEDMQRLEEARSEIRSDISNGVIGRGELYDPFDRVRILADVAPYSQEYKDAIRLAKADGLKEEEELELQKIEERVRNQKEPLRVYDYKFSTANLTSESVTIDKILDNGNFTIVGDDNTSYSLGGIDIQKPKDVEGLDAYNKYIASVLKPGDDIKLKLDADELNQKPRGMYNTVDAIVTKDGKMINRDIVENGFASIDEDDDSAIGVNVRYTKFDKLFGSIWEKFSHMDTMLHTKWLQVRSPLEMYERNVVYGEDFQEWERPIENFLKPTINRMIENPLSLALAPIVGSMFGRSKATRLVMGGLGLGTVLAGKAYTNTKEAVTGDEWKPKTRRKEEETEEYIDKLKYVKNMKLYDEYSKKALKEDNFDVNQYMENEQIKADKRKAKSNRLVKFKKDINYGRKTIHDVAKKEEYINLTKEEEKELSREKRETKFDIIRRTASSMMHFKDNSKRFDILKSRLSEYMDVDDQIDIKKEKIMESKLNKEVNNIKEYRDAKELPQNAMIALEYYEKAQQTVYGYDRGESMQNLMKAIPKNDKDYFKYFIDAPEEERGRILEVIPGYLKNAMLNMWGQHTEKEPLVDYFKDHMLPDKEWVGWDEDKSLDSLRVKMVNDENLEFSNFNIWQDDIDEANASNIPIPKINTKHNQLYINQQLKGILEQSGYENVVVKSKESSRNTVNFNVKNDMRTYVNQKFKNDDIY